MAEPEAASAGQEESALKRWLLYLIVLGLVQLVPVERVDVGQLRPVQLVVIYRDGEEVILETDTQDKGSGKTVELALKDLKETTPAVIYLDTAQYLIVGENALDAVEGLKSSLKSSVRLYQFTGDIDPELAAQFLGAHKKGPRLKDWETGQGLPVLDCREDRIKFLQFFKNSA